MPSRLSIVKSHLHFTEKWNKGVQLYLKASQQVVD